MNTLEAIYSRRTIRKFNGENITKRELDEILKEYSQEPIRLCGDGYGITTELLTSITVPVSERLRHQSAYSVAQVAKRRYESGIRTTDAELVATYLRPSQAERERNERLRLQTNQE